jgi:amidohydrolase
LKSAPLTILAILLVTATASARAAVAPLDPVPAKARIDAFLDRQYPALDAIYRDIHAHPELAFQEIRTADLLATSMRRAGFEVTEHVGKTGIVAVLRNGDGPTVLVRTELDALPMEEKTGLTYASHATQLWNGEVTPVDHSCGHDAHMAWWLGTAEALVSMKDQWRGTLVFIAQPAEEVLGGAKAMIADGLLTRFPKPDFAFAAHTMPAATGTIIVKDGVATSAADGVDIVFHGRGGHGSAPNLTIDPIIEGSHFVSDVQTVISREKDPQAFGVVTVGSFQAGAVGNVIPDAATLRLTLRSFEPDVRKQLLAGVDRTARAEADMAGAPEPTITHANGVDSVRNDSALIQRILPAMKGAFGENIQYIPSDRPGYSASEDFSEFIDAGIPSVFYWIGGYDPKVIAGYEARGEPVPSNHSPYFAPDPEPTIRTGVEALTLSVLAVDAQDSRPPHP